MKVYRLLTQEEWRETVDLLPLSAIDIRDGYIHLSTKEELLKTANLYFLQEEQLIIAAFESSIFGAHLKMEYVASRNTSFPHLYQQKLRREDIVEITRLRKQEEGFIWEENI